MNEFVSLLGVIASIITGVATAILAYLLIRQTKTLEKTSLLASGPKIFPRFIHQNDGKTHIYLYNVGKGNAIDVHLEFWDSNDNYLAKKDRYSLTSIDVETYNPETKEWRAEYVNPKISFHGDSYSFKVKGWYMDTNETKHVIDRVYNYPP